MRFSEVIKNPKMFWLLWGLVAVSWQANALKTNNGGTASETTRAVLHTHTKGGRLAFLGGVAFLVAWFPEHILHPVMEGLSAISGVEDNDSSSGPQEQLG